MQELSGLNSGNKPGARIASSGVLSVPMTTFALPVQEGELLTATVIKTLPDNKAIIDINGQTLIAETKVPLQEGQEMLLEAKGLLEGKLLLQLLAVGKNTSPGTGLQTQVANILAQAGLPLNKENIQILQSLMQEKAQITIPLVKEIARSLQSLGQFDRETIRAAVFLAVRGFQVTGENLKLAGLILREGGGLGNYLGQVLRQLQVFDGAENTGTLQHNLAGTVSVNESAAPGETITPKTDIYQTVNRENGIVTNSQQASGIYQKLSGPGQTIVEPGKIITEPGKISIEPGKIITEPGQTLTDPGQISTKPGKITAGTSPQMPGLSLSAQESGQVNDGQRTVVIPQQNIQISLEQIAVDTKAGHLGDQVTGPVAASPGKPELKTFLLSILKDLLTIDLGEASEKGVQPDTENLETQLKLVGEAWQAKGLLGKILTALGTNQQSIIKEQQLISPQENVISKDKVITQENVKTQENLGQSTRQPEVNTEHVTSSKTFAQGTEQLRDIFNARELLQSSYQKSTESFIGYIPLSAKVGEQFLGGDLFVWKRKAGEKETDASQTIDNPGFHILFLLNTSSLGSWRIDLVTRGENLSINIAVSEEEAGRLVKNRLAELKEKVEAQGFQVNHLNCQVSRNEPGAGREQFGPLNAGFDLRI